MKSEKSLSRVEKFCVSVCSSNRIMVDVLAGRLSGRVSCIFAIQMLVFVVGWRQMLVILEVVEPLVQIFLVLLGSKLWGYWAR